MRKLTFTLALAFSALYFTGCSQSDILTDTTTNETTTKESTGQVIKVTTVVESPQSGDQNTRVGLDIDATTKKLNLIWEEGDKVTVYPYFSDGTTGKAGTPVEATMGTRNSDGTYNMSFDVNLPTDMSINENLRVSGALGVDDMNDNGQATIAWDTKDLSTSAAGRDYKLPMYFSPSAVSSNADGTYTIKAHFKVYGSLINLKLESHLYDPYEPREFLLKTKNFSSKGTMNLADATATSAPSWTPSDASSEEFVNSYFTNQGVVVGSRTAESVIDDEAVNGEYFLWAMPKPDDASTNTIVTATVHDYAYDAATRSGRSEPIVHTYRLPKLVQGNYYGLTVKLTSDLIITEVMSNTLDNIYEIYNPTDQPINLGDYSIVREERGNVTNIRALTLGKDFNQYDSNLKYSFGDVWTRWHNDAATTAADGSWILPPGKVIVYWPNGYALSDIDLQNIEAKKKSAWILMTYMSSTSTINEGNDKLNSVLALNRNPTSHFISIRKNSLMPSTYPTTALSDNSIVDVFFRPKDLSQIGVGVYSYIRRPDRNFPRKWTIVGEFDENADWVYSMAKSSDVGFRYGPYDHVADGKQATSEDDLTYPDYYNHMAGAKICYLRGNLTTAVSTDLYFPPYYWNYYWSH